MSAMLSLINVGCPQAVSEEMIRICFRNRMVPNWKMQIIRFLLKPGNTDRTLRIEVPLEQTPDRSVGIFIALFTSPCRFIRVKAFILTKTIAGQPQYYHFRQVDSTALNTLSSFVQCCESIAVNLYELYLSNISILEYEDWSIECNIARANEVQLTSSNATSTCGFRQSMVAGLPAAQALLQSN